MGGRGKRVSGSGHGDERGGLDRRGAKMMRKDLEAARKKWIEEAKTPKEKAERERSDFLRYQDSAGKFADFHSNRHTFITNLERAGVSPRTAQTLARHCDIRLTMGVYTHIGLHDQSSAIELLPAPPEMAAAQRPVSPNGNGAAKATSSDGKPHRQEAVSRQPAEPIAEIGQLDAVWSTLPDNVKSGIMSLVNAAVKSQATKQQPSNNQP